jgi:uncharacterized protein
MTVLICGAVVRIIQALVEAAPTIFVGLFVAAIFQRVLGPQQTFKLFGGHTWRQIPQAWGMGMLLPVCSFGAIPIMTELRKAGLMGGTLLAFGLTAPIFNPLSVLYGLTLSHPFVILTICMCSLALVTGIGLLWDFLFPKTFIESQGAIQTPYGLRRVASVFLGMIRISAGYDLLYIAIGIVGIGTLGALLPANSLQQSAEANDVTAPIKMAAFALPAYITPMTAMVQLATMFQHGNSIAAAFTLLILGTGLNLGLVIWIVVTYGWKRGFTWIGLTCILVLGIAYAIDKPLYPKGIKPEGHTHAFDQFCNPIASSDPDPIENARLMIANSTPLYGGISLACLAGMVLTGLVINRIDPKQTWEESLARPLSELRQLNQRSELNGPDKESSSAQVITSRATGEQLADLQSRSMRRDIVLPPSLVAGLSLFGLVLASVYGCYIYYPDEATVFQELQPVNAEVVTRVSSRDWQGAMHWIPAYEDWLRKLQVGRYLRGRPLTSEQEESLTILLEKIEHLEDSIHEEEYDHAKVIGADLGLDYFRFRYSIDSR